MNNTKPVLVGGEALYDLISTNPGKGLGGTTNFEKRPGGSPFNIAVGIQRLGTPTAFLGKFGTDQFGEALVAFLRSESVNVDHLIRELGTKTTLAFVAVDQAGKVDFRFYRDHAADISLRTDEIGSFDPHDFSFYHCGGIVLAEEPTASAYASVVQRFGAAGVPVSLDPTIRKSLISDESSYVAMLRRLIEQVSVLKVSDEELEFITHKAEPDVAVRQLGIRPQSLVVVTVGSAGAFLYRGGQRLVHVPGYKVKVVETTGCGDSFMAAVLAQLAGYTIDEIGGLPVDKLISMMRLANAAAAIVATRFGAAAANPTRAEVEAFMSGHE
ncbi:MAG TPA: carbohydrate kinase [Chthoniobacterales bacterium]